MEGAEGKLHPTSRAAPAPASAQREAHARGGGREEEQSPFPHSSLMISTPVMSPERAPTRHIANAQPPNSPETGTVQDMVHKSCQAPLY
jgi:hypothetical protein